MNTKFYRDNGYFDKRRTYIWDQQGSLDDLIIGWIPKKLRDIFAKYQIKKKMNDINAIIVEWINKINKFFYERIWKTQNNDINEWEKQNGISNVKKRKRNQNRKSLAKRRKRKISGKRTSFYHTVDTTFYDRVKWKIGLDFPLSQDKKAKIMALIFSCSTINLALFFRYNNFF